VAPRDRRRPISDRRSSTEITIVLATPTPPTSSATAPRPSSSPVSVLLTAARAARASDRAADLDLLGMLRVRGLRQHVPDGLHRADGGVVSAEQLLERAWDGNIDPFTNVVRVTIMTLRRKLGDPPIVETVPGVGYRLR